MTLELPAVGSESRSSSSSSGSAASHLTGQNSLNSHGAPGAGSTPASSANFHRLHYIKDNNSNKERDAADGDLKKQNNKNKDHGAFDTIEVIGDSYVQFAKPGAGAPQNAHSANHHQIFPHDYAYPTMLVTNGPAPLATNAATNSSSCLKGACGPQPLLPTKKKKSRNFFSRKSSQSSPNGSANSSSGSGPYCYQQCKVSTL